MGYCSESRRIGGDATPTKSACVTFLNACIRVSCGGSGFWREQMNGQRAQMNAREASGEFEIWHREVMIARTPRLCTTER